MRIIANEFLITETLMLYSKILRDEESKFSLDHLGMTGSSKIRRGLSVSFDYRRRILRENYLVLFTAGVHGHKFTI